MVKGKIMFAPTTPSIYISPCVWSPLVCLQSLASSVVSNVAKAHPDVVKSAVSSTASWAAANPDLASHFTTAPGFKGPGNV